jgi:hypothetical protein
MKMRCAWNQAAVKCESIGCVILVKMIKIADTLS